MSFVIGRSGGRSAVIMGMQIMIEGPTKLILDHVRDYATGHTSYPEGHNERDLGSGATGIISTIGPFLVDRFAAALQCIITGADRNFLNERIPVGRVLAQPWKPDRVATALRRRANEAPPPIAVTRVQLAGHNDFFLVVDGCHRTYAARRWGDHLIEAQIQGTSTCDAREYGLIGTKLVRGLGSTRVHVSPADPIGPEVDAEASRVPYDIAIILHALGAYGEADVPTFTFG